MVEVTVRGRGDLEAEHYSMALSAESIALQIAEEYSASAKQPSRTRWPPFEVQEALLGDQKLKYFIKQAFKAGKQ